MYLIRRLLIGSCVLLSACSTKPWYDSPPPVPEVLSPADSSALVINANTTFSWRVSPNAEHYDFHIFNRENGDIDKYYQRELDPLVVCQDDICSVTLAIALPYMRGHAWRVRAGNVAGKSVWSRRLFSMVSSGVGPSSARVPDPPRSLQPQREQLRTGETVEFSWQPSALALSYDFMMMNSVDRSVADEISSLPATTLCQTADRCVLNRYMRLPAGDNHDWRVRAVNEYGKSDWSRGLFDIQP